MRGVCFRGDRDCIDWVGAHSPAGCTNREHLEFSACYAPGTPWSLVIDHANVKASAIRSSLGRQTSPGDFEAFQFPWSELNGLSNVYEPNDDGAAWTQSTIDAGALDVRGDVRIAGHLIDGNSGVLAYNFFPDFGDMVIDTGDTFYNDTSDSSLRLRNVLAHEHGRGLGLSHSCPINQTKLMEPFVSTAFDGPQHDDILGTNRGYGDTNEHNDVTGSPTALGAFSGSKKALDLFSGNARSADGVVARIGSSA